MRWNSIVFKLGATIFIILISVLIPLIFTIDRLFYKSYVSEAHYQINQLAAQYSNSLSSPEDLDSLHAVAKLTKTEICIINREGKILFTSNDKVFHQDVQIERELVEAAYSKKDVQIEYHNTTNKLTYFVTGKPLYLTNQEDVGLLVFSNAEHIKKSFHDIELVLLVTLIGALCMALGFTYIASKKLASPLLQMEKVTRDVAKGKFYKKVTISSNDEVGSLATAINDLGQELERYRNRQTEFFANISHDLRTPISYIKGYIQVLQDELYKDEKEKDLYLSIVLDEANQLNVLITDLFELSKIESGQLELQLNWINVHELIESCLIKVALKAKEKEIFLQKELDTNIPFIFSDGVRLEQILMNLLENAIRYNKLNGHIKVKGVVGKKKVHLSIEDTGVGIPEEDLPYIFERFYKVDKSRSNRIGSTGLGLSIVKHLVLLLEGEIKVKSTLHKGTTFNIALPFNIKEGIKDKVL
jgi:signal transduction histidine kinase